MVGGAGEGGDGHEKFWGFERGLAGVDAVEVAGSEGDEGVESAGAAFEFEEFLVDAGHFVEEDRVPTGMTESGGDVVVTSPAAKFLFGQMGEVNGGTTGDVLELRHERLGVRR